MTESFKALDSGGRDQLAVCLAQVTEARAVLREAQRVRGGQGVYQLRMDLVAALEAYGALLSGAGVALPRQLRSELELHRAIGHHT